jgi:hypothetical protein
MKKVAAFLLFFWPLLAISASYRNAQVGDEGSRLTLFTSSGRQFSAKKLPGQVGFDKARVSDNGKHVAWLALYSNCCTSYPIPLKLIVLDGENKMRTFSGNGQSIFDWCFLGNGTEVAYRQGPLHFTNYQHFERRRLSDGKLLAQYDYPDEEAEHERARKQAPSWVQCVPE